MVGFRPEAAELAGDSEEGLEITVQAVEELGSDAFVHASLGDAQLVDRPDLIARIDPAAVPAKGSRLRLRIKPDAVHLFAAGSGERIETA